MQAINQAANKTALNILFLLGLSHMFNDILQSIISAIYPLLKDSLLLTFAQIGIISLVFQLSSSIFQPIIGLVTDKKPQPYSLVIGMSLNLIGILTLSISHSLGMVLIAVFLTGLGSSIFHPEASRLAYMASGGKYGMAQSLFQVGGNLGGSLGPLLVAYIITPYGQQNIAWFGIIALISISVMFVISKWYKNNMYRLQVKKELKKEDETFENVKKASAIPQKKIVFAISILLVLIFSKYVYMASLTSYYTFYLIDKFAITTRNAQILLFVFLFAVALGTLLGGPIGDRIGRKYVIWGSILGVAPFTLMMPHVGLVATCVLSVVIGFILSSAFSAILVYAQELIPGKVGLIGGLFFGFAFGVAGIASAILGKIADQTSIQYIYNICAYLPLIGLITIFLPKDKKRT